MKKRKLFPLLLLCLFVSLSLTACDSADPPETTDDTVSSTYTFSTINFANFTIVRPDSASDDTVHAATTLRDGFADLGLELTLTTDWVNRGEEVPVGTAEILLGNTNRPETEQFSTGLRIGEYTVGYTNGRYVLVAGDDGSLTDAVTWLLTNLDTLSPTNGTLHTHTVDYRLGGGSLCGNDIADYEILYVSDKNGEPECGLILQIPLSLRWDTSCR